MLDSNVGTSRSRLQLVARHRAGEQVARLLDRRERVGVGRVDVAAVLGVDVGDDRDLVAQVVEDDEHVAEHQRHVGQPELVRVRLAERLDRAHQVVAEVADGAAGERRHVGERRLAVARDLLGGDRVRIALVAQRPAHDLARAQPDEAVAPDPLALLGGLQQERRVLAGCSPRSFRNAETGVSQSSMKRLRSAMTLCSRASSRTSSSDGSTRS